MSSNLQRDHLLRPPDRRDVRRDRGRDVARGAHDDPRAYNEPGAPDRIGVKESHWPDTTKLTVPKHSVTIARIELQ